MCLPVSECASRYETGRGRMRERAGGNWICLSVCASVRVCVRVRARVCVFAGEESAKPKQHGSAER